MTEVEPIEVRRYGSRGATVVVLHGGPGAPGSAGGLARALAEEFVVLEPLQRRSGKVPLTVARHVEDLAAVAPERAAVVGWSWGAMLGLSYAARDPARVSELVLVGCGTYDEAGRALYRRDLWQRLGESGRRAVEALERRLAGERDPARRDAIIAELAALHVRAQAYEPLEEAGDSLEGAAVDAAGHAQTWDDVLRLQREGIEPRAFAAITARVLMVHGDADPHPGAATRDLLRRFIPRLEYVELARCGHEPWRERHARGRFLEVVRGWVGTA